MKHILKTVKSALILTMVAYLAVACSAKIEGGGGSSDPIPFDVFSDKTKIAGPDVVGQWSSGCAYKSYYSYEKVDLSFNKETFTRATESFSDSACTNSQSKSIYKGKYIFSEKYADGSYEINYAVDIGNGWYQYLDEKLLLENGNLYLSFFVSGSGATVNKNIPLKRPTTNPVPPPAPVPAKCGDYTGSYQMNSDYFSITQTECSMVTFTHTYPSNTVKTYYTDGVAHDVNGLSITASFKNGLFQKEYSNSYGDKITEVWSMQKRPCNLINPSGSDYLTRDVWINGVASSTYCMYFAKTK